jgi:gamma-glutamyltranspeptidase
MTRPPSWALAAPERHAADAGADAFAAGGNAIDAALATAVSLAVTYPHNCGVGGDLFAVVRHPDGRSVSVNASGPAARAVDAAAQRARGPQMPMMGPDPITVPGVVRGWEHLHVLGAVRPWHAAFEPARRHAEEGVEVSASLAAALRIAAAEVAAEAGMTEVFRPRASLLARGDRLRQPALARTLERIAQHGAGEFYEGDTGARLVAGLARHGSRLDERDFAGFAPEETPPLTGRYQDLTLITSPPNASGVLLLQALAALEAANLPANTPADVAGMLADLVRSGAEQREAMLADPRGRDPKLDAWLGETRLAELVTRARAPRAVFTGARPSGDTVAVVTADDSGMAVSLIQSLFSSFGACVLEPATGVLLHNRGASFSLEPGHPNELAGGRRPSHTLMPLVVERDGELAGVLGTMGGNAHAQVLAQVLLGILAGLDPQSAVAAPRWVVGGLDPGEPAGLVRVEDGVPAAAISSLDERGLEIRTIRWPSEDVGHAQAIWSSAGVLRAGSDPRADGAAVVGPSSPASEAR